MFKKIFLAIIAVFIVSTNNIRADEPIHLNIGDAKFKKSLLALPPLQYLGTSSLAKSHSVAGKEIFDTLGFDLKVSSFFEIMNSDAYVEDTTKVGLRPVKDDPNGFNYSSWKQLKTDFLIRMGYKILNNEITLDAYVYYVPQEKKVLAKTYQGSIKDAKLLAHTFANDLVKELTDVKGIFLTKIVAARSTEPQQKEIFLMEWDGSNMKPLTRHKSISNSPAWSPDGKTIAYRSFAYHTADKTRNADLFFVTIKNEEKKLISARPGINSGAAFFPDGRHIALTMTRGESSPNIYKMTVDGRSFDALTSGSKDTLNVEPDVSPDGKRIVFSSDRDGRPMIYSMDTDGNNVKRLTIAGEYNSTPKWSPDGKKIVFAGSDRDATGKSHFDLFVMDADGTNMIRLTSARKLTNGKMADNEDPSWSPDGRHVVFTSSREGHHQLYIIDADGENERRITFDKYDYYKPTWSPYLD